MKRAFMYVVTMVGAMSLVIAGCSQAPPPAAPTKAAEPTRAPAQAAGAAAGQPATTPAKKVDYPTKGKTITVIVPVAAGGSLDVGTRLLAPLLEKEFGVAVEVVNRVGGGQQVGITELVRARPDGHTIAVASLPGVNASYLDPNRKAVYGRKDLQPVVMTFIDPIVLMVPGGSPFKTMKEIVDGAKAKPETIKASGASLWSAAHLAGLELERVSGAKFAFVNFDGNAPAMTALLGGHVDGGFFTSIEPRPYMKTGDVRVLGIADSQESKFLPDVRTMESQGYKVHMSSAHIWTVPAGTPKEILEVLSGVLKKSLEAEEIKAKLTSLGWEARYMDTPQASKFWDEIDTTTKPLLPK